MLCSPLQRAIQDRYSCIGYFQVIELGFSAGVSCSMKTF